MITPNKNRYGIGILWLWLFLLIAISMVVIIMTGEPNIIFSILGYDITGVAVVTFILGIIATVVIQIINHYVSKWLNRSPKKIFDSHFGYSVDDLDSKLDKKVIFKVGKTYNIYYFIQPKKLLVDVDRIGVRPQRDIPFWKRVFREYNLKTDNIKELSIVIKSIKDVTPECGKSFDYDKDDGVSGRWGFYKAPIKLIPGRYIIYELVINALKKWDGYIDFRTDTPDGRRVVHHKVTIREGNQ